MPGYLLHLAWPVGSYDAELFIYITVFVEFFVTLSIKFKFLNNFLIKPWEEKSKNIYRNTIPQPILNWPLFIIISDYIIIPSFHKKKKE